jgi:branched-chain amino acid transport system substrate-binding protein
MPLSSSRHPLLMGAVALAGLASFICTTAQAQSAATCTGPIKFGLTTAMTGNLALLGIQAKNGVEFAVEELNAKGGIAGQKIELAAEDTGSSATDALNAMNRVIEGKPLVIFSSMISPHVFTQTEVVKKSATPFLVGATNARITDQGTNWLFRIHAHDGQLADLVPRYLVTTLGKKKPGIIAVADDYGLGASRGIQATLASMGITAAAATSYAPSDKDMTAQLLEIKDKGADSVIVFGRPADVTIIMKQMSDLGIGLAVIGNASTVAQTTLDNLQPAEADGAYAIGGMIPQTSTDPAVAEWQKKVFARYKVPADNFTVAYYDAVQMLKQIIETVGCDRAAIRDKLAATRDWKGMLIGYTADQKGDLVHTLGVYRNRGKTPTLVSTTQETGF